MIGELISDEFPKMGVAQQAWQGSQSMSPTKNFGNPEYTQPWSEYTSQKSNNTYKAQRIDQNTGARFNPDRG